MSSHHHLILFHLNVLNHHISSLHFFSAHSSSVTSLFFPSICSLPPTCFRATLSSSWVLLFFVFRGKGSTLWTLKCRFRGRHSNLRSLKCKFCGRRSTLGSLKCKVRGRHSTLWTLKCKFRGRCSSELGSVDREREIDR